MRAMWWLFWRTSRWEVATLALATIVLVAAAAILSAWLNAAAPSGACLTFVYAGATAEETAQCGELYAFIPLQQETSPPIVTALALLPLLAGVLVGSQLVSREIDHRTAVLSWSAVGSRARWLVRRSMPATILVAFVSVSVATASTILQAARYPGIDIGQSFAELGQWGPVLGVRGMAAFFVALLVGAVIGRSIPALLASGILVGVLALGSTLIAPLPAATEVIADPGGSRNPAALYKESVLQDGDGKIITFAEGAETVPSGFDAGDSADWIYTHFRPMAVVVPGREAPMTMVRDATMLLAMAGASAALVFVVVRNRRPY